MESHPVIPRSSSCRGVSFEVSRMRSPPFSVGGMVARNTSGRIFPFGEGSALTRTFSKPSSHFCDLEAAVDDDDHDGEHLQDIQAPSTTVDMAKKTNSSSSSRLSIILLDQGLFTVYKRLFVVSLTTNLIFLALSAAGRFPYGRSHATLFSIANIFALVLCRSEAFLRIFFWLAVKVLGRSWIPLRIKTAATSLLQSVGGIHSSCGVSSVIWLVYSLTLTLEDRSNTSSEILSVAIIILSLLFLSALAAFPVVRHLRHDLFERIHRFAGWSSLALLWVFVFLTVSYNPVSKSYSLDSSELVRTQEFWFTVAITVLVVLPWLTIERVAVKIHSPTGHASIIKFSGGIKAGLLGRIARSPLSDWHAFGIISDGMKEHMMLAGAVGDFTRGLVSDPPSHLWVRRVHFAGLPYLVNMYNKVLLVATGSGLCVFLSFLVQPSEADVHLVWVAKEMEKSFGGEIMSMVNSYPSEKMIIHDTTVLGRPDVAELVLKAAEKWRPEAVVVTSNPEGSRDVMNACKKAGVAAFGPIWDS